MSVRYYTVYCLVYLHTVRYLLSVGLSLRIETRDGFHSRNSAVFLDYVVPKIPRSGSVVLVFVYNILYNFRDRGILVSKCTQNPAVVWHCSTSFCVQYCQIHVQTSNTSYECTPAQWKETPMTAKHNYDRC